MTKTDIAIYRGLKEKFDPEVHVGFFITTDTGELLLGDQSLGQTISGWEINDGVLILKLNTGKDIRVTFPEATETVKGLLSAADKAQLNALQANLDSKVDKVTGKSLLADSEIEKLAGLPNSTELTNSIATAKAAGDNAQSDLNAHKQNKSNPHEVTKAQVGLGNVTNDAQVKRSEMGVANGVATLDADGKVPASQLPSYVDDIIDVYATYSKSDTGVLSDVTLYLDAAHTQLVTGETGKIYQNIADGEPQYQFRWTGTIFSQTGASSLILGEVTGTAYDGAKGKVNADNIAKIKGTSLSHIKDAAPVTTAADKVSINYECYEGNQYGAAGTDHTADIPAATTAKAGVMSAADKTKLEDLNSKLVVADEEDVTAVDGKIKFKDRDTTNGMGYKILRLPENGILTQDMINQANTIYEIRYDFDLNGATITIPENCTLKFEGGKLSNGTLVGASTTIKSNITKIFELSITVEGTWNVEYAYAEWFGAKPNVPTLDNTDYFKKTLNCFQSVHLNRSKYYLKKPLLLGNKNYINGNKGKLNFTITDTENPCCIKMGAHCVVEDITIEIDDTTSIEGTSIIWFQSDYMRATQDTANDYNLSYRSAHNYALRNIDMCLKNKEWMQTPVFKYTGIKVTGEDYPISSGIAFNFRIRGYWKYGIYIDLSDATVDTTEGWFTSGQFTNGSIGSSLFGIYIDSSSTHAKNVPPTGLMFTNISIQTMGRFIKSLFEANTETRAIKLKECKEITFRDCYLWDWTDKCFGYYHNTPAPVSLSTKSINIVFDNTGCEYIKLYDVEQPLTSEFLDNPPVVRNRSTLRFNPTYFDENITKEEFRKFFICLPEGTYTITKSLLKKFIEHTSNLNVQDIDNLVINNNASLKIYNHNMFRIFELEIAITDFTMERDNAYYLFRSIVTLGSNIISNNFSGIRFQWFRIPVNTITKGREHGFKDCGNIGESYIDGNSNNQVIYCVGPRKYTDSKGYNVARIKGTTVQRPSAATSATPEYGQITSSDAGFQYFDTNLNRPVYWDGTKWIDPAEDSIKWRTIE